MLKNSNKSANSRTESKTLKSLIIWPIYVWIAQKTEQKTSCKYTFKTLSFYSKLQSFWLQHSSSSFAWFIQNCHPFTPGWASPTSAVPEDRVCQPHQGLITVGRHEFSLLTQVEGRRKNPRPPRSCWIEQMDIKTCVCTYCILFDINIQSLLCLSCFCAFLCSGPYLTG